MDSQAALQSMLQQLSRIRVVNVSPFTYYSSVAVAAVTLWYYDIAVKFQDEVRLIWTSEWTVGKCLYLINRYFGLIILTISLNTLLNPTISPRVDNLISSCTVWYVIDVVGSIIQLSAVEAILAGRTYALYRRNRTVGIILAAVCGSCMLTMFGLGGAIHVGQTYIPTPIPGILTGCVAECSKGCEALVTAFWVPLLVSDSAKDEVQTSLLTIMYRDGFLYFVGISVANTVIFSTAPVRVLTQSLQSAMCSRLVLNIRGNLKSHVHGTTSSTLTYELRTLPVVQTPGEGTTLASHAEER
ncbi:hypothetical protein JB92DRAFT_2998157 [Gautieria morchelliformis]|nr:hypothetical protein JB92DRAFT_2998157 [Gautieria morchelliformis]